VLEEVRSRGQTPAVRHRLPHQACLASSTPRIDHYRCIDIARYIDICQYVCQHWFMASATVPSDDLGACCSPLTVGVLDTSSAERIAHVFKALADPARVKLLSLIAATDGGEACVCDLTGPLELTQPTVSHHMKMLVDAGLVSREPRGKWAYYRVNDWALERIAQLISPACS
jgi:ArsR family transcriptional regulator